MTMSGELLKAIELLANGPMPEVEVARLAGINLDGYPYALTETNKIWITNDEQAVLIAQVLDGICLTHEVTAEEAADGRAAIEVDLSILDWSSDSLVFGDGPLDLDPTTLKLPSAVAAGDVLLVRCSGLHVDISVIDRSDLGDGVREAEALRKAFIARFGSRCAGEVDPLILDCRTGDRSLFATAVPPVHELLSQMGFARRNHQIGPTDEPWDNYENRFGQEMLDELFDEYEFDHCCESAFARVLRQWASTNPNGDSVARDLAHGPVAVAFTAWSARTPNGDEWMDRFVGTLSSKVDSSIRTYLSADLASRGPNHDLAVELFEAATESDNEDIVLEADMFLAYSASHQGDAVRAHDLLRQNGIRNTTFDFLEAALSPSVGRNDPCVCGSGRKFKACCANRTELSAAQRLEWLMLRLVDFAADEHRALLLALTALMAESTGVVPDEIDEFTVDVVLFHMDVAREYQQKYGAIMHDEDRRFLELLLEAPLDLWTVTNRWPVTVRSGDGTEYRAQLTSEANEAVISGGDTMMARLIEIEPGLVSNAGVVASLADDEVDRARMLLADLREDFTPKKLLDWRLGL